jgi:hypothetical protein
MGEVKCNDINCAYQKNGECSRSNIELVEAGSDEDDTFLICESRKEHTG